MHNSSAARGCLRSSSRFDDFECYGRSRASAPARPRNRRRRAPARWRRGHEALPIQPRIGFLDGPGGREAVCHRHSIRGGAACRSDFRKFVDARGGESGLQRCGVFRTLLVKQKDAALPPGNSPTPEWAANGTIYSLSALAPVFHYRERRSCTSPMKVCWSSLLSE